jgi:hypothetical protein
MTGSKRKPSLLKRSCFFLVYPDSGRGDLQSVDDYELGDLDVTMFWSGQPYEGGPAAPGRIILSEGKPADMLGNPMSWLILSAKCAQALAPLLAKHVQVLPLPVVLPNGRSNASRYVVVNPLGSIDAIHRPRGKKENVTLMDLVIDPAAVPDGCHLFRLTHQETVFVASARVIECIMDHRFQGFAVSPVRLR